uniref:Uncharacterized protein n=1 Tax=Acrobeloides nanus TaxID=290746 RepID=A0A914CMP8_9BILA
MKFILPVVFLAFSVVAGQNPGQLEIPKPVQPPPPVGVNIQGSENGAGGRIWGNIPIGDNGAVVKPYIDGSVGPNGGNINGGGVKVEIPFGK